jgi:translation elongation factor P/translation initiation factor 5A
MMKKTTKELKKGDKIVLAGTEFSVEETELSEIGKQGTQKCRIVAVNAKGEKVVVIRPADFPFEVK